MADWSRISSRELALAAAGRRFARLTFWAWNASIHLTTIAASVTLVNLQPAVVAVISAVALKEAPTGRQITRNRIAITWSAGCRSSRLKGGMAQAQTHRSSKSVGDFGGGDGSDLLHIGRSLRRSLGVWANVAIVY